MSKTFQPMLAATMPEGALPAFPCLASPKLDGVRAVVIDRIVYSRNLKPIPNRHVQDRFGKGGYEGFDGELVVGDPCSPTAFRDTMSGVMSTSGTPDVMFHVFDTFEVSLPFDQRYDYLKRLIHRAGGKYVKLVHHERIKGEQSLMTFEEDTLAQGYEGVMIRAPGGGYKNGRATAKEGTLLKMKRFADAEARVIGMVELMHNGNEATTDELGRMKRSSHKANKRGLNVLGALIVEKDGIEFQIGTGWTMEERRDLWSLSRGMLIGRIVKFKYFPTGSKTAPRFPVFLGFRDQIDM